MHQTPFIDVVHQAQSFLSREGGLRARLVVAAVLLAAATGVEAQELGTEAGARFNAQNRARVAVLEFDDSNSEAIERKIAASVEGMLVTALQRDSQFTIVERQNLKGLYEEKRRIQQGLADPEGGDASVLLKTADAFILGKISLLDGSWVEIDTKVFSGFDGQVVAAVQRSGDVACLRSIVERLGTALVQEILRPYQGNLEVRLMNPESVHIFLAPIPLDSAPDRERAPAELSSTVRRGDEYDTVDPWVTDSASYTIKGLLSGWYTLRLARPGYEDVKTGSGRFEVRQAAGKLEVYDRTTGLPLDRMSPELRRFVVRVDPQTTGTIDGDTLGFTFRKKRGSLAFRVKRQYLDKDFTRTPQRVILMGGTGLELSAFEPARKVDDDPKCNLLREPPPLLPEKARTIVALGQTFDFNAFQGGELIIEDYQGEIVPAGQYQVATWDLNYKLEKFAVTVRDGDRGKVVKRDLLRETRSLTLEATGPLPRGHVFLKGNATRHSLKVSLDFPKTEGQKGVPVDTYKISTDVPGLEGWKRTVEHLPSTSVPPRYFLKSAANALEITNPDDDKPDRPSSLIVKTRFALAGRLGALSRPPDPQAADLFLDEEVGKIFDHLFHEPGRQLGPPDDLRRRLAQRLEVIDLLVLNARDMAGLRKSPETAAIVQGYIKEGGALFAFVSEPGDYGDIVGAPLVIEAPGRLSGKRPLPKIPVGSWREEEPWALERGEKDSGGYVAIWLGDPESFRDRQGRTATRIEEARGKFEERILKWAKYSMYRRYDKEGKLLRQAAAALGR